MSTQNESTQKPSLKERWPRRRSRFHLLLLAGGVVGIAVLAAGFTSGRGPFRGMHGPGMRGPGHMNPALMRDRAEWMIDRALNEVDATEAQRAQIESILDQRFGEAMAMRGDHEMMHGQIKSILTADTVDRAALERLRADKLARAEEGSRLLVETIADVAEVLTPQQRRELAEYIEERMH